METDELLVELEAIRESFHSHWRSMKSEREEEVFKRARRELDTLILTVRQREINIFHSK
jgi:hypothetical protein